MPDILITGGTLVGAASVGYVYVAGGRIAAFGSGPAPVELPAQAGRVIDARHMAILPGLVNSHTHLSQTFLRGLAGNRPLLRWLKEVIWPAQAAMTPDDMYLAALLGLIENLRCGVTAVIQHHKLPGREFISAAGRAAAQVGIRMLLARGWVDLGADAEPLDHVLDELTWLHETWHGRSAGRIRVASGPMAPWRCSDDGLRQTVAQARSHGLPTHLHAAETRDEVELMVARCGKRPVEWLADLDCLGPDTQIVHAVHLSESELDLIAGAGAAVVYCPTSNMFLASGAAAVPAMLRRGIRVALGTDGPASNDSQDLLACAKIGILLARHAAADAAALHPADMLAMMTQSGAALATWGPQPGSLKSGTSRPQPGTWYVGAPGDVVLVDLDNPRCQPVHDVDSALIYGACGPDVHTVMVDGQVLLDAGRVTMLDETTLLAECRQAAAGLLQRASIMR